MRDVVAACLGPRRLRFFVGLAALFLAFYALSNWETVAQQPGHAIFIVGSLAQFFLPLGVALGSFLAISARPLGLDTMELHSPLPQARLFVGPLAYAVLAVFGWQALWILLLLAINASSAGSIWRVGVVVLYPAAAMVLGCGMGFIIGRLGASIRRAKTATSAYAASIFVAFLAFLVVITSSRLSGGNPRYSIGLPSLVLDPSMRISSDVLLAHIAVMGGLGFALLMLALLPASRTLYELVPPAMVAVIAAGVGVCGAQSVAAESDTFVSRTASKYACLRGGVEICYWDEELQGAKRLVAAMQVGYVGIPLSYRPVLVLQEGIRPDPRQRAVYVLQMPLDDQRAARFASELLLKQHGCTAQNVADSARLSQLMDFVYQSSLRAAEQPPRTPPQWLPSSLAALSTCGGST